MKKVLNLFIALLLPAALCLPAVAQEDGAAPAEGTEAAAAKPAVKKAAPKAKAKKKKKPAAPVSEYKFTSTDAVQTYKFDKKANPIVKPAPRKKGVKAPARPTGKLPVMEKARYINEESATKALEGGQ